MDTKKAQKSTFSNFFLEDSVTVKGILDGSSDTADHSGERDNSALSGSHPTYPKTTPANEDELKAWWRNLRTFFRTGKGGGIRETSVYPALLAPYRNQPQGRSDYPLWLADEKVGKEKNKESFCSSLPQLIKDSINSFAAEGEAIVLRSSIDRMVEATRQRIGNGPQLLENVIGDVLSDLVKNMDVKGDDSVTFAEDLKSLENQLPEIGVLIPFSSNAAYQVLGATLTSEQGARRNELKAEISLLCAKLKDILSVETEKGPSGKKSNKLKSSYDFADSFLNFDELSNAMPDAGSELMEDDRFKRIEGVLKTLEDANSLLANATIIVQKELHDDKNVPWKEIFADSKIKTVAKGKMCAEAGSEYTKKMKSVAGIIAAMRISQLEVKGLYNHEVHGDYFVSFDWHSFTDEEMAACPPVILIADVAAIIDAELSEFSHMLSSNIGVKILAVKNGDSNDFRMNGNQSSNDFVYRQELAALAVSHRNTFVMQSTSVSPVDMFKGFSEGLASFSPALFYVLSPGGEMDGDSYLWTSAAVEGREFPCFIYKGGMDSKWGSRFDINNNPQAGKDWPVYELKLKGTKNMDMAFTFADFAAQSSRYDRYLQIVPSQYWTDDLVGIADYLDIEGDEKYSRIPFIWMTDGSNTLQKVAVAWPLVLLCRERLDFWQYIQENGGVNSYHVEKALDDAREELKVEAEKELTALKDEHLKEIEVVKDETAGQAMEKLTAMLLDLDSASLVAAPTAAPAVEPAESESVDAPIEETPAEEDVGLMESEVYIDTPLCTTCDECVDLNGKIFRYNADKLAEVFDPRGGSFEDIVESAELCPVSIIHPGTPQDPNEPNLDDLVKRAEKYN